MDFEPIKDQGLITVGHDLDLDAVAAGAADWMRAHTTWKERDIRRDCVPGNIVEAWWGGHDVGMVSPSWPEGWGEEYAHRSVQPVSVVNVTELREWHGTGEG